MKRFGRPSPAMVVALIALVFAMTGSAAAVVSFARNAGAVDGKSATSASASNNFAAGKLVATRRLGALKGTLPSKFLDPTTVSRGFAFGHTADVIDNGSETGFTIVAIPGVGTLSATCVDENKTAGKEDPRTTITFGNQSGESVEYGRATGTGAVAVAPLTNNQTASFSISGDNLFTVVVQRGSTNVIVQGAARGAGAGSNTASCVTYGRVSQLG